MMKKKEFRFKKVTADRKSFTDWKLRRDIILKAIPLEVDLENRQIILQEDLKNKLNYDLQISNIDKFISTYVDPKDSQKVMKSLNLAAQGQEKPITFNVIHPETSKKFQFEYRYEIVYVKYASTRLNGVLVNIRPQKKAPGAG